MDFFALVAGQIWDGRADDVIRDIAVVVGAGRIESIMPAPDLPADLRRIELPGCTLIPGMIDAHVHYSASMGPGFLAAGVTTIRDVGNDLEWILQQRERHRADPSIGPAIVCCGHLHDGIKPYWPRMGKAVANPDELRISIQHHVARGVDQIKLYTELDLEMLSAGVAEAHRLDKFVLAHLGKTKAEDACRAGLNEIEHFSGCAVAWKAATIEEDDTLIDLFLEHKVVMNPTLVVWDRLGRILERSFHYDERRQWAHPCHQDIWNRYLSRSGPPEPRLRMQAAIPHLKRFLLRAQGRGVTIALGTDTPFPHLVPGFSVHDELAMYVDAGIKPVDALRSATSINAAVLGLGGKTGHLAPGLAADLVAMQGNPLEHIEDIGNIACVVRGGHIIDRQDLLSSLRMISANQPDDAITNDLLDYIYGRR
ncbi:MAG: amidohydrolase family protein [Chloroflexi bacterium]|nr:amidohydrolase family protein [Chloroflexota bacterium]